MEPMKNLCGLIPESLHKRLMEGKSPEMTNSGNMARNRSRVRSFRTTRKNGRWPLLCPNLFSTALSSMWRRIMAYPNESSLWGWWHRNSNLG